MRRFRLILLAAMAAYGSSSPATPSGYGNNYGNNYGAS